jgi:hypothetical protein
MRIALHSQHQSAKAWLQAARHARIAENIASLLQIFLAINLTAGISAAKQKAPGGPSIHRPALAHCAADNAIQAATGEWRNR